MAPLHPLVFAIVLIVFCKGTKSSKAETQLFAKLFKTYNNQLRPIENVSDAVQVTIGLTPYSLLEVNEVEQFLLLNVWYRAQWFDPSLTWEPQQFGNMTQINVPSALMWTPPVSLLNAVEEGVVPSLDSDADDLEPLLQVKHDGYTKAAVPVILKISCAMDMKRYPFDDQECQLSFGTWEYTDNEMQLRVDRETSALQGSAQDFSSGEWNLLEYNVVENFSSNFNGSTPVAFSLTIRRNGFYHVIIAFIPCLANALLALLVFLLPPETGERIAVGVNTLLIMWVNYLRALNSMPMSPDLPLFCKFSNFVMFQCVLAIAVSSLLLSFYHMNANIVLPQWVKVHILDKTARLVLLKKTVQDRMLVIEKFRKEAEDFRAQFGGKAYYKLSIGLNLFVNNSLREFEVFWQMEEWRLVALVLERLFTFSFLFTIILSFLTFAVLLLR